MNKLVKHSEQLDLFNLPELDEIIETQVYIMSDANKRLLNLYFKLGKIIYENSKWGNKFIKELETE